MPRKIQTGPSAYVQKPRPVLAMRVEQPYKHVTAWCGWEPIKRGARVAFLLAPPGAWGGERAYPGDYIVLEPNGTYVARTAEDFESNYERSHDNLHPITDKEN